MTEQAIQSVLPAQLKKGTEECAINEILTSYSFVRRAILGRYWPVLPLYSLVLRQYFILPDVDRFEEAGQRNTHVLWWSPIGRATENAHV